MILDKGFCSIYSTENSTPKGSMPKKSLKAIRFQSYYGELDFETAPIYATEKQKDIEISARVRILQCREISNNDVAILSSVLPPPGDSIQFEITRAYHGREPDNGRPITDLTLREVQQKYDIAGIPGSAADS